MDHIWERYGLETAEAVPRDQLLHLLTCQECRQWLLERLLEEQTEEDLYAIALRSIEDTTPLLEAAEKRRSNAEGLLGELLSMPPEARGNLVTKERFRSLDLLDLLVDLSHSSQPANPAQAQGLAEMASRLAAVLGDEDPAAATLLPRALCLEANARRLQHDLGGAEAQLGKVAPFLACAEERAFYSRTAAVVRWEEGRTEEALALLGHALRLFPMAGSEDEADVCLGLTGLLLFEENQIPEALPRLHRAWRKLDRERRPPLTVRIGMALAISLALAQQRERARQVRQEAWKLYSKLPDAREMLRVYGYEGRLLGLLGELKEAEQVLESVRQKLVEESSGGEAALVSLDLAMVLAAGRRVEDVVRLSEVLEQSATSAPLDLAVGALMNLASHLRGGEILPWEYAGASAVALRRSFRAVGLRLHPLPFA